MTSTADEDIELQEEVNELELKVKRAKLRTFYILFAWISVNVLPLIGLLLFQAIQFTISTPKLISINPLLIGFGRSGVPITQLLSMVVIAEIFRNTITLHFKGMPSIAIQPQQRDLEAND